MLIGIAALISAFQGEGWGVGILGAVSIVIGRLFIFDSIIATQVLIVLAGILLLVQGGIGIVMAFVDR